MAQALAEGGGRAVLRRLPCTAAAAGKPGVAGKPAVTAPAGAGGGVLGHTGRSVRWHACPEGGTSRQREQNAARNILRRGSQRSAAGPAPQARTQPLGADGA